MGKRIPKYEIEGEQVATCDVATIAGVPHHVVRQRIDNGWSLDRVISTPTRRSRVLSIVEYPTKSQTNNVDLINRKLPISKLNAGDRVGRLVLVERAPSENRKSKWYCDCECGTKRKSILAASLKNGLTLSCGCLRDERARIAREKEAFDFSGYKIGQYGAFVICKSTNAKKRKDGRLNVLWVCQCPCGNTYEITACDIRLARSIWCDRRCTVRQNVHSGFEKRAVKLQTKEGMLTYEEIAKRAGITREAVRYRIKKAGMTPDEACLPSMRQINVQSVQRDVSNDSDDAIETEGICHW